MGRNLRFATVYLALAAMMLRALLPTGWMPSFGADHGIGLSVCSISGPVQLDIGPDGKAHPHHHTDGHSHETCPFAAAPHFASSAAPAGLATPTALATFFEPQFETTVPGSHDRYPPQLTRGPPYLA
jgi:hypothetical protein